MVYKGSQGQTDVVMDPSCFSALLKLIVAFLEMYIKRLNKKKILTFSGGSIILYVC